MSSATSRGPRKSCSVRLMGAPCPLLQLARRRRSLLAQRAGDESVGAAVASFALPAWDQDLRRAALRRVGVQALAFLIALVPAEPVSGLFAVGRAVWRSRADGASRHHCRG